MGDPPPDGDIDERLFALRLARSRDDLIGMLELVYGERDDFEVFCDALLATLRRAWAERPADLKWLDLQRDLEPDWFQRPDRVGYVFYVDRFAGDLRSVHDHLDWLERLGVTYVHLMPLLAARPGDNDGGYSVIDYRRVEPELGTMDELETLAGELRRRDMSLCIDLVLNHTAREHEWAERARRGEARYRDYYLLFDDIELPRRYEESLVEVFPNQAPGNFTFDEEADAWVWTTFNRHQWDLNWANPWVFREMVDIALGLANRGADVLRLDAVAFMWKRLGTRCQSEPEVHVLLHAFRAATRIAAASTIHLAEAIVGPAEMIPYLGSGLHAGKEGNLAYHNSLMVQFWSSLAARDARMMGHVLRTHFPTSLPNATYATYLRCHDDIGWAVTDEDAAAVGWSGAAHRAFLTDFYTGEFPGSFARGTPFQVNPATNDARVNGSLASLAGLEQALEHEDRRQVDLAVERILLGHALIASFGGIPLLYMGDEIALLNVYDQAGAADGRWIHRPVMDWERAARAASGDGVEGRVLAGIEHILARRRATPELHGALPTIVLEPDRAELFAFSRDAPTGPLVCVFNFSESPSEVDRAWLESIGVTGFEDALADRPVDRTAARLTIAPYGRLWLR